MPHVKIIRKNEDIPLEYQNSPVEKLLLYQNQKMEFSVHPNAEILIGMCMDYRKHLNIPENFAYIIRTGGANLRYSEFKVAYAIAVGKVQAIALIGHNNCGMVGLSEKKEEFVKGMVNRAGWEEKAAEEYFLQFAPLFQIPNELDFVLEESQRIRKKYQGIQVAPLLYDLETNLLGIIEA